MRPVVKESDKEKMIKNERTCNIIAKYQYHVKIRFLFYAKRVISLNGLSILVRTMMHSKKHKKENRVINLLFTLSVWTNNNHPNS
jgi:hypothetical protein